MRRLHNILWLALSSFGLAFALALLIKDPYSLAPVLFTAIAVFGVLLWAIIVVAEWEKP